LKFTKFSYIIFLLIIPITLQAQFYFFGRNKVQYEKFEWKVLKTEHFNIYYYDDFGEMAEIGAKYAEDAYEEFKQKFNHVIIRKIPLIFYNTSIHFQQTNTRPGFIPDGVGGFFEFMKGRVVIPYLGSLAQFEHVIRHELIHVFMTNYVGNVYARHRVPFERYPPLWFIEGIAEFWSTNWDSQGEMVMRDAVLNGIFSSLRDMPRVFGTFIMYKAGQKFLEFAAEEYGEHTILELLNNTWRFTRFEEVIEYTFSESMDEINDKFEYYLKSLYYPLYADGTPHKGFSNKITKEGFNFSPSYYESDEGKSVFYLGNSDGYSSVYKVELDDNFKAKDDPQIIIRGEKEDLFEKFHLLKPSITASKSGVVAFVTKSGRNDAIHFYSIEEEELISTFSHEEIISIEGPSFSESGDQLVFTAIDKKGYNDLYVLDVADQSFIRLTNDYFADSTPQFYDNDNKILFTSDRTEGMFQRNVNLFSIDLTDYTIDYLTYVNSNISEPTVNRFTDEIYFTSDYDGIENIWKLEFDNSNNPTGMIKQTYNITPIFEYEFIDTNQIVYSAIERFSFQLYTTDLFEEDSTSRFVAFNFSLPKSRWDPERISLSSVKQKLEYENEYTLDYAVSQVVADPVYGARGGAILSLSDMLGDDKYFFLLYNTAEIQSEFLKNFNVAITRVNSKYRTNYGYGVFHFSGRRYDIRDTDEYFRERSFGGVFSLIYPFSKFQRIESSVSIANSDKELAEGIIQRKALLLSNTISYVHDNSIWGSTGPVDGSRLRLLLGYISDIKYSNVNYYSAMADYRYYFRISNSITLAARGSIFYNHGKEARRYFAGGSWDLRGWKRFSIRGEKLWLSSVELRFPLINQFVIQFPFLGLGFANIRGAAYFDAGSAWDEKYKETLGSVGTGIRINFLNAIAFRYDIGKKIENDFRDFQDGLFYQFFFGWDF
jgi:hypothetical protein